MLKIGDGLPDFEELNQEGKLINSKNFSGKKLIIFFYPAANTPTCTIEACNLSSNFQNIQKNGFEIIGISADSVKKQQNFHKKFSFPYDLIADTEKHIINKFGVWQEKTTFGKTYMGIVRTTFLFNEKGICTGVISDVKSKIAAEQILDIF